MKNAPTVEKESVLQLNKGKPCMLIIARLPGRVNTMNKTATLNARSRLIKKIEDKRDYADDSDIGFLLELANMVMDDVDSIGNEEALKKYRMELSESIDNTDSVDSRMIIFERLARRYTVLLVEELSKARQGG